MRVLLVDGRRRRDESERSGEAIDTVGIAETALRRRGHDPTVLSLIDEGFDRFMSEEERRAYHETDNLLTPEQRRSAALLGEAEGLLVVSALRGGTIDPVVKSWFERVFVPGVSFTFTDGGRVTGALKQIRRVGMVLTCPDGASTPHRRNGSTRSVLRGVRLNAARSCRTTYVTLAPGADGEIAIERALRRW